MKNISVIGYYLLIKRIYNSEWTLDNSELFCGAVQYSPCGYYTARKAEMEVKYCLILTDNMHVSIMVTLEHIVRNYNKRSMDRDKGKPKVTYDLQQIISTWGSACKSARLLTLTTDRGLLRLPSVIRNGSSVTCILILNAADTKHHSIMPSDFKHILIIIF